MKMLLPPGWDKPGEENEERCRLFEKRACKSGKGYLPYRFFVPDTDGKTAVPLVIYLHGADAAGDDNEAQLAMHDIGTFLARKEMQRKHPCYIIAPQYGEMMHWSMKDVKDALLRLIDSTINDAEDIDRSRIYIYGYSAGGVGTLRLVREHPNFFAAAISICGATGTWDINNLLSTPLWMIHAADDNIVKATYRTPGGKDPANMGSRDIYDWYLKKKEEINDFADIRYTEYPEGWMKEHYGLNPHCSWVTASNPRDTSVWEWMFSKRLGT